MIVVLLVVKETNKVLKVKKKKKISELYRCNVTQLKNNSIKSRNCGVIGG